MIEFEILAQGIYRPDQLLIHYAPSLRMPTAPAIQAWMDNLWQQKLIQAREKGIPLYDSKLYRLEHAQAQPDGMLELVLGDTGYKEYVTTRVPEFAQGRRREELGNALSVCSVVETCDNYILLEQRQGVDTYVGRYHVIGGFFERDLDTTTHSAPLNQPDPFRAITREIREETGVQSSDILEQYCLGAVYDLTLPHAELCFLTRLHITLAEVFRREPEDHEIQQLQSLLITKESLRDFIIRNHSNISATGEPNLLLYGGLRFGERWREEVMGEISSS